MSNPAQQDGSAELITSTMDYIQALCLPQRAAESLAASLTSIKQVARDIKEFAEQNANDDKFKKNFADFNKALSENTLKDIANDDMRAVSCFVAITKKVAVENKLPLLKDLKITKCPFNFDDGKKIKKLVGHFEKVLAFLQKENKVGPESGADGAEGEEKPEKKIFKYKGNFAEHARVVQVGLADLNHQPRYTVTEPRQSQNGGYFTTGDLYKVLKQHRLTNTADSAAAHVPGFRHYNVSSIPSMQYTDGLVAQQQNQKDKPEGLTSHAIIQNIAGNAFTTD